MQACRGCPETNTQRKVGEDRSVGAQGGQAGRRADTREPVLKSEDGGRRNMLAPAGLRPAWRATRRSRRARWPRWQAQRAQQPPRQYRPCTVGCRSLRAGPGRWRAPPRPPWRPARSGPASRTTCLCRCWPPPASWAGWARRRRRRAAPSCRPQGWRQQTTEPLRQGGWGTGGAFRGGAACSCAVHHHHKQAPGARCAAAPVAGPHRHTRRPRRSAGRPKSGRRTARHPPAGRSAAHAAGGREGCQGHGRQCTAAAQASSV